MPSLNDPALDLDDFPAPYLAGELEKDPHLHRRLTLDSIARALGRESDPSAPANPVLALLPRELLADARVELSRQSEAAAEARASRDRDPLGWVYRPGIDAHTHQRRPWAIENLLIDRAMGLGGGGFKAGKSSLMQEYAVSLTTGTPCFGVEEFATLAAPAPVLVIQTEVSQEEYDFRLNEIHRARGVKASGLLHVAPMPTPPTPRINLVTHFDRILDAIKAEGYRWIVLDPIYQLVGNVNPTTWDNGPEITECLTALRGYGCAPLVTSALKASARSLAFNELLGATIFAGWMESGWLIRRRDVSGGHEFTLKRNVVRDRDTDAEATYKLQGLGSGRWTLVQAASDDADAEPKGPTGREQYVALMKEQPNLTQAEAAKALGVSDRTIRRYAKEVTA